MSEARHGREYVEQNATHEPEQPTEADPLRHEAQGPPVSLLEEQTSGGERDASLGKMLGTKEARVLVVEAVGSRSWSERIELVLPRTAARQVEKGRASPSQTVRSADADDGSLSSTRDRSRRAATNRAQSAVLGRRGIGQPGVRAKRCAGVKPERHREGMSLGSVRRCEASGLGG